MDERQRLIEAWSANVVGSSTDHVIVVLPSFSLSETLAAHYGARLPALEHRFLVASLMLARIPACEMVFFACAHPGQEVLDYYLDLAPEEARDSVRRRLSIVVVDDHTARGVAEKLLDRPDITNELRTKFEGRLAFLEPWNVTSHEVALAGLLDIPVNGTSPELWPLGFKSAGRRIFRRAGVPLPLGLEDIHDLDGVRAAMAQIRQEQPEAAGVVIKHDNSGAGDGNHVVRFGPDETEALGAIPTWFVRDLQFGCVVEELITGEDYCSPSVQVDITPQGEVIVLSSHEQLLGESSVRSTADARSRQTLPTPPSSTVVRRRSARFCRRKALWAVLVWTSSRLGSWGSVPLALRGGLEERAAPSTDAAAMIAIGITAYAQPFESSPWSTSTSTTITAATVAKITTMAIHQLPRVVPRSSDESFTPQVVPIAARAHTLRVRLRQARARLQRDFDPRSSRRTRAAARACGPPRAHSPCELVVGDRRLVLEVLASSCHGPTSP